MAGGSKHWIEKIISRYSTGSTKEKWKKYEREK